MTLPEFMTQKELAAIIRVSPLTVHRLTKRGELKAFKVGRSLRYARADVEAYVEGRREVFGVPKAA
jgi:putative molybdopterin biosynthesis protein